MGQLASQQFFWASPNNRVADLSGPHVARATGKVVRLWSEPDLLPRDEEQPYLTLVNT
jgi:hypothetical protein